MGDIFAPAMPPGTSPSGGLVVALPKNLAPYPKFLCNPPQVSGLFVQHSHGHWSLFF